MIDLSFLENFFFPQSTLDILNTSLFNLQILDVWLLFHFVVVFLGSFVLKEFLDLKTKTIVFIMSAGIIGAELVEKLMISQGIILPEPGINVLLDLVVGFFALWIVVRKN